MSQVVLIGPGCWEHRSSRHAWSAALKDQVRDADSVGCPLKKFGPLASHRQIPQERAHLARVGRGAEIPYLNVVVVIEVKVVEHL